jgi:hypothetical protein
VTVTDAEAPRAALDRRRDRRGWLLTPAVTLLVAPALTASIGILTVADSDAYPRICSPVLAENGCQEAIFGMFVLHARIFAVGRLLLFALPWWRGLRPYRIWLAVAVSAILLAAPLGLMDWSAVYRPYHVDQLFDDRSSLTQSHQKQAVAALIAAAVILVPLITALVLLLIDRRRAAIASLAVATVLLIPGVTVLRYTYHPEPPNPAQLVHDPFPPCVTHSGSNETCPGD